MSELIKVCEFCKRQYEARRERQHFCSKECQYAASHTQAVRVCQECGEQFTETPSRIADGKGRFCSRQCYATWQSKNTGGHHSPLWKGGEVELTCEQCGGRFMVVQARAAVARFCSWRCAGLAARVGAVKKCEVCGKQFYDVPSMNRRFCSWECRTAGCSGEHSYQWAGGKTTATCAHCGKTFAVYQYRIDEGGGRFCSKGCANKANALSGDKHPHWKGGISFEPYPITFNAAFKRRVRKRDNGQCAICRLIGHDVHHIDYDKAHTNDVNCITLCHTCHSVTNHHRPYWQRALSSLLSARLTGANL